MAISQRELAFFGGWSRRVLGAGVHRWGDPMRRVQEVAPAVACDLLLPPDAHIAASGQRGVPYYVVNTGGDVCVVRAFDGGPTVVAVAAGVAAKIVLGSQWRGWTVSNPQFGGVQAKLVYELPITQNVANLNVLERIVAMGYDGSQSAAAIITIESGVVVGSANDAQRSLRSGTTVAGVSWAMGSKMLVRVVPGGTLGGWGGAGGNAGVPGTGGSSGANGGNGGQAIRTEIPLTIECGGAIFGGGGGGGGGGSTSSIPSPPTPTPQGAGGGGGVGCNMWDTNGALGGSPSGLGAGANPGTRGGMVFAGAGGVGLGGGGGGGTGGGRGTNGTAGGNASPSGGTGGAGGSGAAAISYLPAAGAPTIISGAANIVGGSVSEAG
jgi:hypothetical protein